MPPPIPRITGAPRAPLIEFPAVAPAPHPPRQAANNSAPEEPAAVQVIDAVPAVARAPPAPRRETPKPLLKQGKPAGEIGRGFRAAVKTLTLHAPTPKKKPKEKERDTGKAAIAPRRRVALGHAAKAMTIPLFVQRLIRFFAAVNPGTDAMHTDPRYRDTLGAPPPAADAAITAAPEITAPSLDL